MSRTPAAQLARLKTEYPLWDFAPREPGFVTAVLRSNPAVALIARRPGGLEALLFEQDPYRRGPHGSRPRRR